MEMLEIRELRYFVAVAERLHFGRAARQLRIAQPALSKTIQRIESRLGVDLFVRTSRSVTLTAAGTTLLEHGRHALNAMDIAVQKTQQASEPDHLRLAMKPGGDAGLLPGLLAAYAEQQDARRVEIVFCSGTNRAQTLRDGQADVALLYAPFDDLAGLTTVPLHVEDRVALLPQTHPLARRANIRLKDLAAETFARWVGVPTDQSAGPEIEDVTELVPLVQIGRVVAVLPRSLVSPAPPATVCVPVEDAGTSTIVLAHNANDHRNTVAAFVTAASSARVSASGH
ncbi:LysR family transcriptional regulator [Mycolicibacterium wolinskyi]|uniref:Probable hydrogen peroxide-inducible genes activator n=2 Tax=Mycolicibacterium wolinskyi TaxID=59750 RepID=A0A1X2FFF9_9MYCO|nr:MULTISPECIES: LysR family transcriptional regulator [Mycolicibacterium]MCV7290758.1 LysR family transcriptional regulator [Mycolicibacterium wolinskyi]MCV7291189.1 LysR family transcriptional regulator [Mycolicibacterium goodii]ORX17185.1 LysR family transcriptional regulator [Mycolicibacterium wolinskyi]